MNDMSRRKGALHIFIHGPTVCMRILDNFFQELKNSLLDTEGRSPARILQVCKESSSCMARNSRLGMDKILLIP